MELELTTLRSKIAYPLTKPARHSDVVLKNSYTSLNFSSLPHLDYVLGDKIPSSLVCLGLFLGVPTSDSSQFILFTIF